MGQRGQVEEGLALIRKSIAMNPANGSFYNNLGKFLMDRGERREAKESFQRVIALGGDLPRAYNNLGILLVEEGALEEAVRCFQQALALEPGYSDAHNSFGNALAKLGRGEEAGRCFERALALKPTNSEAYNNLGNMRREERRLQGAGGAIECYRKAVSLNPNFAEGFYNLANALNEADVGDEALEAFEKALRLKPGLAEGHNSLGNALKERGRLEEALACYERAMGLAPGNATYHGNRLLLLNYLEAYGAKEILRESVKWDQQFGAGVQGATRGHGNERSPERRLRVGYVSGDFWGHAVACFLVPLLGYPDRERLEVFCYWGGGGGLDVTRQLKGMGHAWRDTATMTDEAFAEQVRRDGIDVLVDLSLHTAGNRLAMFARKPAPVQVTYLGYAGTTGLSAMDYRLTDPFLDPVGEGDGDYSERSVRLPRTFWCYQPVIEMAAPGGLPALGGARAGGVTFGCFNQFAKVSARARGVWARILLAVPGSRLLMHAPVGAHREQVREEFVRAGVEGSRVEFVGRVSIEHYFERHELVDVGLDPFPFGGGTTSCDALWMGVPLVTLRGRTAVGRGGVSLLSNLGMTEWIAGTEEEYVAIAVRMAGDLGRLAEVRAGLRERMRGSAVMDVKGFARDIEGALRGMWRNWCAGGNSECRIQNSE